MRLSRIRTVPPVHRATSWRRAAVAVATVSVVTVSLVGGAQAKPSTDVKEVKQAFHEAEAASEQVNQLSVQIKQTNQEISDLSGDIDHQMVDYQEQKDALSSAIVQQHMDAPLGPTVNLLGSGDPDKFLDGLGAVQALNSTRADQLEKFGKTAKQLKNRRDQLEDRETSLAADKKDMAKERDRIRAKFREAKRKLALLDATQRAAFGNSDINLDFEISASGRAAKAVNFAMRPARRPLRVRRHRSQLVGLLGPRAGRLPRRRRVPAPRGRPAVRSHPPHLDEPAPARRHRVLRRHVARRHLHRPRQGHPRAAPGS